MSQSGLICGGNCESPGIGKAGDGSGNWAVAMSAYRSQPRRVNRPNIGGIRSSITTIVVAAVGAAVMGFRREHVNKARTFATPTSTVNNKW